MYTHIIIYILIFLEVEVIVSLISLFVPVTPNRFLSEFEFDEESKMFDEYLKWLSLSSKRLAYFYETLSFFRVIHKLLPA
jgi:hypothetical protein